LNSQDKCQIANGLFDETLFSVTEAYASVLRDIPICEHYGVNPRSVSSIETTLNIIKLCLSFLVYGRYPGLVTRLRWIARVFFVRSRARSIVSNVLRQLS
jgi:hypothetical protein